VKVLTLDDFDLKSKTVFLRVDMNYPIDPEILEILGTKRIEEAIETLEALKDAKLLLHLTKEELEIMTIQGWTSMQKFLKN